MKGRTLTRRTVLGMGAAGLAGATFAQRSAVREEALHGRRAFVLENERMRVAMLPGGGFVGEIRFKSDDPRKSVNPMRVPHYQTIDPYTYDIGRHGAIYGTDIQRRLMSGYMGDFLCFPNFGPSSKAEFALDLGQHGEALAVEWKRQEARAGEGEAALLCTAELPKTQYVVRRSIILPAEETVAYVEESVENLASFDRPVQWVRHVTFGPPFLELNRTFVDACAAKTVIREGSAFREGDWPQWRTAQGELLDQRVFSGRTGTWLLDRSRPVVWFTIYSTEYPVLLGYVYQSAYNPWVLDWQENMRAKQIPWDGKVVARAICIGDSPLASGLRDAVTRGRILGVPLHSWIAAKERRTQNYLFFLAEIPPGFGGVADLRLEAGQIVLVERGTGRAFPIPSARRW